ncbi:MAG: hypothetical protein WC796_02460 [Candidatus Pacearchaeota archaeon]|jgi:hypothetical protein
MVKSLVNSKQLAILIGVVVVVGLIAGFIGVGIGLGVSNNSMTANVIKDSQAGAGKMNAGAVTLEDTSTKTAWQITHRGGAAGEEAGDLAVYYKDSAGNWDNKLLLDKSGSLLGNNVNFIDAKKCRVVYASYPNTSEGIGCYSDEILTQVSTVACSGTWSWELNKSIGWNPQLFGTSYYSDSLMNSAFYLCESSLAELKYYKGQIRSVTNKTALIVVNGASGYVKEGNYAYIGGLEIYFVRQLDDEGYQLILGHDQIWALNIGTNFYYTSGYNLLPDFESGFCCKINGLPNYGETNSSTGGAGGAGGAGGGGSKQVLHRVTMDRNGKVTQT